MDWCPSTNSSPQTPQTMDLCDNSRAWLEKLNSHLTKVLSAATPLATSTTKGDDLRVRLPGRLSGGRPRAVGNGPPPRIPADNSSPGWLLRASHVAEEVPSLAKAVRVMDDHSAPAVPGQRHLRGSPFGPVTERVLQDPRQRVLVLVDGAAGEAEVF